MKKRLCSVHRCRLYSDAARRPFEVVSSRRCPSNICGRGESCLNVNDIDNPKLSRLGCSTQKPDGRRTWRVACSRYTNDASQFIRCDDRCNATRNIGSPQQYWGNCEYFRILGAGKVQDAARGRLWRNGYGRVEGFARRARDDDAPQRRKEMHNDNIRPAARRRRAATNLYLHIYLFIIIY